MERIQILAQRCNLNLQAFSEVIEPLSQSCKKESVAVSYFIVLSIFDLTDFLQILY